MSLCLPRMLCPVAVDPEKGSKTEMTLNHNSTLAPLALNLFAWCFGQLKAEHVDRRPECFASDAEASGERSLSGTEMQEQEAAKQRRERSLAPLVLCWILKRLSPFVLTSLFCLNAWAGLLGFGGDSWKEEVLLHDGQKIIVKRSQTYGGRVEPGQGGTVKEHTISFEMPKSGRSLTWKSEYGQELGRTNFNALALHIQGDTPYLVVEPNLCLSHNKWGRPNPPYVIFRYDGQDWQRIELAELPTEFKHINLIVNDSRQRDIQRASSELGYVSAEGVDSINRSLTQPEYKAILREPIDISHGWCTEMIRTGDGWSGLGAFQRQGSLEVCLQYCAREKVSEQNCPCSKLFERK
jgi:hypothetical protein